MADENLEDQNQNAGAAGEKTPPDADGGQKPPWERDGEEPIPEGVEAHREPAHRQPQTQDHERVEHGPPARDRETVTRPAER
ncbi:hypothetical protein [Bifidobacterium jacchi]|uniref:Uncharacterized protein n=1 Tax=Bifidobacterium jacchi TaxID=2490545 RepID=A0A5N5RIC0_9BIFI|nr:hypothetical protein [Bifidobacterium jacchi]KAB5606680.1 hypothetical protein EHS19_06705 [Bifidobacterium jacchi]